MRMNWKSLSLLIVCNSRRSGSKKSLFFCNESNLDMCTTVYGFFEASAAGNFGMLTPLGMVARRSLLQNFSCNIARVSLSETDIACAVMRQSNFSHILYAVRVNME